MKSFLKEDYGRKCYKNLKTDLSYKGGNQAGLICKNCDIFRVQYLRYRETNTWRSSKRCNKNHSEACGSVLCTLNVSEVIRDPVLNVLVNRKDHVSHKVVSDVAAVSGPRVPKDVIKKSYQKCIFKLIWILNHF